MRTALLLGFKNYFYITWEPGRLNSLHECIDGHSNRNNTAQVIRRSSSVSARPVCVPPQLRRWSATPFLKFFIIHIGLFVQVRIKKKCWFFFRHMGLCHENRKRIFIARIVYQYLGQPYPGQVTFSAFKNFFHIGGNDSIAFKFVHAKTSTVNSNQLFQHF